MKTTALNHHHRVFLEAINQILESFIPLIIGLVLFLGGLWLVTLPIPVWKLVLGLPSIQLGIVVLMFTFDKATKKRLHPENFDILICPFCSQENLIHLNKKQTECMGCKKIITQIEGENQDDDDDE